MLLVIGLSSIIVILIFLLHKLMGYVEEPVNEAQGDITTYDEIINDIYDKSLEQAEEIFKNIKKMIPEQSVDKTGTLGLMFDTLKQLGCQPQVNEDDTISVQYQGEEFFMDFGGRYVRIWDPRWYEIKADDPDLPKIRKLVNSTNFNFGPTVVLSAPSKEGIIEFHSRFDIMLHPACPDNVPYVEDILNSFFTTKQHVCNSLMIIKSGQKEAQRDRRPVGFTVTSNTSYQ